MSTKQYWFISVEYLQMPPQVQSLAQVTQAQPELVKMNKIIDVHPAIFLYRSLRDHAFFHVTFAMPCPADVLEQVKREVAAASNGGGNIQL